jgi:hypothetical protein
MVTITNFKIWYETTDLKYQQALRVFVVVSITILTKHAGSSGHAAQQNALMHKLYKLIPNENVENHIHCNIACIKPSYSLEM